MRFLNSAVAAAVAGAFLLATPALRADQKDKDHGHGHWDRFEMLKKKLDLSTSQVDQWKQAEKDQMKEGKLLRDKVKADTAKLAVLVDEQASDDQLTAALDGLAADHKAQAEGREKFIQRLRGILSPLQQAKAALMLLGRHGHGRRGGFDRACGGDWGRKGGWGKPGMGPGGPDHWQGHGDWHPHGGDQGAPDADAGD